MISFLRVFANPSIVQAEYLLIVTVLLQSIYYLFIFNQVGLGLITGDASADIKTLGLLPVIQRVD
jgi:hypothetical protein